MNDGELSYCPLGYGIRQKLLPLCLADQLFCIVCNALAEVEAETALSPEEVWSEALNVAGRLGDSPRPDIALRQEYRFLAVRYASLSYPDGHREERKAEDAERTRCAVCTVLLFMLASASKKWDDNPNKGLSQCLAGYLCDMPFYDRLCLLIRENEAEEERMGRFVSPKDYLKEAGRREKAFTGSGDLMRVGDLVDETLETFSIPVCENVLSVLCAYNDKHGHAIQPHVTRLREGLYGLRRQGAEPRKIENHGTYNEQVTQQNVGYLPAETSTNTSKYIERTTA